MKDALHHVIIDTDPGIDDAIAIMLALSSPKHISVHGLSIVHGNASVDQNVTNAYRVLEIMGQLQENETPSERTDGSLTPVYRGAARPLERNFVGALETHGEDGMGNLNSLERQSLYPGEASCDYLVRMVNLHPSIITLTPIGPLTNIALAVQKDKQFSSKVKRVVLMGGSASGGNRSPVSEFNFWADPHAADIVLTAGFREIILIGLDVTRRVILTPTLRELLYQYKTRISQFIHRITRMYNDFHFEYEGLLGSVINDPLVIAYLIDPSILRLRPAHVRVVTDGLAIGQSIVDMGGKWNQGKCNCLFAYDVDVKKFFEILINAFVPEKCETTRRILDKEFVKGSFSDTDEFIKCILRLTTDEILHDRDEIEGSQRLKDENRELELKLKHSESNMTEVTNCGETTHQSSSIELETKLESIAPVESNCALDPASVVGSGMPCVPKSKNTVLIQEPFLSQYSPPPKRTCIPPKFAQELFAST